MGKYFLSQSSGVLAPISAELIWKFGKMIAKLSLGNKAINLEIGIACYQAALQVYQRNQFPQEWAATQANLANGYKNRIKGNKAENIEKAILAFENALQIRTKRGITCRMGSDSK
ncbi:MAG: tetratricopeptide repeat protein [Richelia sp. RM1_1_1]|nr:tetratricopeptide repeat protein [Richelia sp. RM1_1_1]